jgi:hypothetical protein
LLTAAGLSPWKPSRLPYPFDWATILTRRLFAKEFKEKALIKRNFLCDFAMSGD